MITGAQRTIIITVFVLFYINAVISSCRNDICFTWKVSLQTLTLICKVDNLHLSVYIGDPTGKLQADCLPPSHPNNCEPYYKNSSVIQYRSTNETVFRVNGNIDYSINGNWTCRHGTRKEIATVEVSVLTIKGDHNDTFQDKLCHTEFDCTKSALLWSLISYFSSVMICMVLISTGVRIFSFRSMNDMMNIIIKRVKRNQYKNIAFVSVYKKISFIIFTVAFFSLVVFLNLLHKESCPSIIFGDVTEELLKYKQVQFVSVGLGVMFGSINSVLFLNKDGTIENIPGINEDIGDDSQRLSPIIDVDESIV